MNDRPMVRLADGRVVELHERDADEGSNTVTHFRVVDTVGLMRKAETIDAEHEMAADDFRRDFRFANLSGIVLSSVMERVDGGHANPPPFKEFALSRVNNDIRHLGGIHSMLASVVWDVIGLEISLTKWAAGQRWSRDQASGILVGALQVLAVSRGYLTVAG